MEKVSLPLKGMTALTSSSVSRKTSPLLFQSTFKPTASARGDLASLRDREWAEKCPFPNQSFSVGGCRMQSEANWKGRRMILYSRLAGVLYLAIYHFRLCL